MIAIVEQIKKSKTYPLKALQESFTSTEVGKIVNMKADDVDDDDAELLALAKSRRSNRGREFTSIDEFINFLEK